MAEPVVVAANPGNHHGDGQSIHSSESGSDGSSSVSIDENIAQAHRIEAETELNKLIFAKIKSWLEPLSTLEMF
jgi:hypothetical protein